MTVVHNEKMISSSISMNIKIYNIPHHTSQNMDYLINHIQVWKQLAFGTICPLQHLWTMGEPGHKDDQPVIGYYTNTFLYKL